MTTRPTLALLIPAYNAAAFLPRLLTSAAEQSEPFDEIWVYDDCSTDDTAAVAGRFGARVVRGARNVGCTEGKRHLLGEATTDWVHFHDADDELLPAFCRTARDLIRDNQADVFIVGAEERSETDPNHLVINSPDPEQFAHHPFVTSIRYKVNAGSGIYNTAFLRANDSLTLDPLHHYVEDQAIQLGLVLAGARFVATPTILVRGYLLHGSMSRANGLKCLQAYLSMLKLALSRAPGHADRKDIEQAVAERLWLIAAGAPVYDDFATAREAAELAKTVAPIPTSAGNRPFRMLAGIAPALALRLREYAIRGLKPELRAAPNPA